MRKLLVTLTAVMCSLMARADEGMWMLSHINPKTAETMKSLGLTLTPEHICESNIIDVDDFTISITLEFYSICIFVVVVFLSKVKLLQRTSNPGVRFFAVISTITH